MDENPITAVRYEDGTERCPECGALVPEPEPYGTGTIRRPVEHRAWCSVLRRLEPTERELPPGPIWTNGAAHDDQLDAWTPERLELEEARERLRRAREEHGRHANAWIIGYVASGAAEPTWPAPQQRATLAALDLETLEK